MVHQVFARRTGAAAAVLRCEMCAEEQPLREGRFDDMNDFIREHKGCVEAAAP